MIFDYIRNYIHYAGRDFHRTLSITRS